MSENQSEKQLYTLFACSVVTGSLSLMGSLYLLFSTSFRWSRQHFSSPRDRILIGLSFFDLFSSISWIAGATASPAGEPLVVGAHGTLATCEAQAFFLQLGVAVPIYDAILAFYYSIRIVSMISDEWYQKYVEGLLHLLAIGFAFGTAITGLVLDLYNSNGTFCWVEPYPPGCADISGMECTRGKDAKMYSTIFGGAPLLACFLFIVLSMTSICTFYPRQANQTARQGVDSLSVFRGSSASTKRSSAVASQALLFVAAFLLTYSCGFVIKVLRFAGVKHGFWLRVLNRIFLPLQGFWNCLIIIRPTYLRLRAQHSSKWWYQVLWKSLEKEAISFTPPGQRRRASLLQEALRNSRQSRSSMSLEQKSFQKDKGSSSSLPCISDLESEGSSCGLGSSQQCPQNFDGNKGPISSLERNLPH